MTRERTGFDERRGLGLSFMTRDNMDTVHHAACRLLHSTGILVGSKEAVDHLHSAGAQVAGGDKEKGWRVHLPDFLVNDSLAASPKSQVYYARDPRNNIYQEPGRVIFGLFSEPVSIIDPHTRRFRDSTKKDNEDLYRLIDALPGVGMATKGICACDMPPESQAVHSYHAMILNTSKHLSGGVNTRAKALCILDMLAELAGGHQALKRKPLATSSCCPISPLSLPGELCEVIITLAEHGGININIMVMTLAGGTSPVTLGATIVQTIAEHLAGITLAQSVRRGANVALGSCSTIMDLKKGLASVGCPEWGLIGAAIAQMGAYYGLPTRIGGGVSDAKAPDPQSGYEFATNALTHALAGATQIFGLGCLDNGLAVDYAKVIMDHDCVQSIQRILDGVSFDNEGLALELIEEVGPNNTFLTTKHTLKRARTQSQPWIFDRRTRQAWLTDPKRDLVERAYAKALYLINTHEPAPLPSGVKDNIDRLVAEFDQKMRRGAS
jgi:trimethylamine--corrinoid protein Co-methyltransferase